MNNDVLFANAFIGLLILFALWWIYGHMPETKFAEAGEPITILVKNGIYQPSIVRVSPGKKIKFHFFRADASPCTEAVIFKQLNLTYQLPLNKRVEIILPAQPRGEVDFSCQMGMLRGKILVG